MRHYSVSLDQGDQNDLFRVVNSPINQGIIERDNLPRLEGIVTTLRTGVARVCPNLVGWGNAAMGCERSRDDKCPSSGRVLHIRKSRGRR